METEHIINKTEIEIIGKGNLTKTYIHKVKQDLPKYLSRELIDERISQIPAGQNRMLMTFLWMSGVRISEAINLLKKDIDFNEGMMTIRWLKSKKYKNRVAPIHSRLLEILRYYTATLNYDTRVFPITRQRAFQISKQFLQISPHQLRHSFAVNWLRCGGDIVTLHRVLGHSKIQTTMEYLKIVPIDQMKELEKVIF
jgi:integrase